MIFESILRGCSSTVVHTLTLSNRERKRRGTMVCIYSQLCYGLPAYSALRNFEESQNAIQIRRRPSASTAEAPGGRLHQLAATLKITKQALDLVRHELMMEVARYERTFQILDAARRIYDEPRNPTGRNQFYLCRRPLFSSIICVLILIYSTKGR